MKTDISNSMFRKAQTLIPGGVNSPVRACKSVGCDPVFIERAAGSRVYDVDGNSYTDFVCSWGPMILGHNYPAVADAIRQALENGTSFGAPTPLEIDLAEMVVDALPSVEMVRFVSSGTEATMSAIRLARGYTGRNIVVKFDGGYHGHADSFLVKAGSGVITLGIPGSPGVPDDIVKNTISIPYNNLEKLEETLRNEELDIACVIIEPVAGNMGVVAPAPGFLKKLRKLTEELGILLIFDEVITGFRVSLGGAQAKFGINPDLTCLGKIIGGGLPVGAYGGKKEIMAYISPEGPVYQAGTLSGNPLAMAAGKATLTALSEPGFYDKLDAKSDKFAEQLFNIAQKYMPDNTCMNRVGSVLTTFFAKGPVTDFESAMKSDTNMYGRYYREMRAAGIYLAPAQFEGMFISAAHSEEDLAVTLEKTESVFRKLIK
ncbi:MAG: glutamate-1-semialdehyde 2,1-aminomutase [Proteobacteria bacterium]|nr:glutamate-1-semialdehyde 2,1-aminomutase [Pseudomonadota bacterium]MBU1714167.1 glutamate-1-semialdehyde 2,1-aminomutase [Pseudomonadota bacterium]